jgi:hypothetical protein
MAPE